MQQIKIENQLKNHGFVSSKWCRENNIPTIILTRLVKQGKLEAVSFLEDYIFKRIVETMMNFIFFNINIKKLYFLLNHHFIF